ncbi:MAG TPA: prepilin-type N-terminal cleavage/methylation domain-containing protein [Opitutales bacterium]|nr:prepilin-type N-terminal cleavage/methylation domain-containing protein [Opitutales bacterium]
MSKHRHHHAGFSLVETLVAMFIFILAVGVLAEASSNALLALSNLEITEGRDRDYQFVRDQVLTISDTDTLSLGGDVQTPNAGGAHWDLVESETTSTPDLFTITISIALSGNGDVPAETSNETLEVLQPQWSDTEVRQADMGDIESALQNVRTQQVWP